MILVPFLMAVVPWIFIIIGYMVVQENESFYLYEQYQES